MSVRILADFHHHALAESYLALFEDRFGWEVWFPAGMEWYTSETWNFERAWHGDKVARQYLEGIWAPREVEDGIVLRPDPRHPGRVHKGITHDRAADEHWDIVLSSLPHNDEGYHRFAQRVGAVFGVQVGNNHQQSRWDLSRFILSSSTLPESGLVTPDTWGRIATHHGVPTVVYHQEFSLDTFHPGPSSSHRIESFVNCFPEGPSYPEFLRFAREHPEFEFRVNGATGRPSWWTEDGPYRDEFIGADIGPVPDVAQAMRDARVIWHTKHWSDGFGHTIHNAFAVGRPVIGYARYYQDKLAGPLWLEGVTSFDVEHRGADGLAALLRSLIEDDDRYQQVCDASAARFREVVDFDGEANAIRSMLEAVL